MPIGNKLSAVFVTRAKKPGRYGDGGGLYLQVSPTGTKAWLFRFMLAGKARAMGLGPVELVTLAQAREKARAARQHLLDRVDPIEARREQWGRKLADEAKKIMFKEAAERFIAAHKAGWRNPKHAEQWRSTLAAYAFPVIGDMSVAAVETAHILKVIEPIWATKTETASRVRGRIEVVLDWAKARHYRQGDNPARWRGHLDKLLPAKTKVRKVRHQPAMPYGKMPAFMDELRGQPSVSARALELTILTAARTGEVIGASWPEIDFAAKVWTIPGERPKSGREHRVPLSARALAILLDLPRVTVSDYIFPGAAPRRPLSNMAMLELLRGMNGGGFTVHGFRSSFRDWAGEQTNFAREIAETALAHVLSDKTEAAYRRGDALEKRRRLMEAWAGYCGSRAAGGGEIVPLRRPRVAPGKADG